MEIVRAKKKKKPGNETGEISGNKSHRRTTVCIELSTRHLYRRAFSEISLLDACGQFEFKDGESYHFITAGDVDSLSYLKAILRQQPLTYCLLSTWCMAAEDILQLQLWCNEGRIKKLDMYVGEIFPSTYKVEFKMLQEMFANDGENVGGGDWQFSAIIQKYMLGTVKNSPSVLRLRQMSIPIRAPRMDV